MISLISIKLQGRDLDAPHVPIRDREDPNALLAIWGLLMFDQSKFRQSRRMGRDIYDFFWGVYAILVLSVISIPFSNSLITCYSATTIAIIIGILCPLLFISTYIFRLPETTKPPWMFLLLDRVFKFWIEHIIVRLLYVIFRFFTRIF